MSARPSQAQVRLLTTPSELWLSCEDCFDLMDVVVDQLVTSPASPVDELPRLRVHLRTCPACAEEVASLLELVCREAGVTSCPARTALGLDGAALPE